MKFVDQIRLRLSRALTPALVLVAIFYFGYHAVQGNHGLLKLMELRAETIELEAQASEVAAEKVALEIKVNNLRKDNLDLDLLDERAREVLGWEPQVPFEEGIQKTIAYFRNFLGLNA